MEVVGGDGVVAGTIAEVWVDTAEPQVRYYEVELLAGGRRVLLPYGFAKVRARERQVRVKAIHAAHFADVPGIASPDVVTLREEDQVMGYYAGGYLWADPSRAEPLL
jgi:photosynthetic reaction center H subunit